ncbi:MAG: hypothetical protein IPH06_10310 [Alphaproteobacteria bacterium]|nr:hypothetical protein [Alphaproteobacteria bacterium]QQS58377.1 MAG: hypothetical protein IPN28_06065 [Alphaproteobacteria bacterium]
MLVPDAIVNQMLLAKKTSTASTDFSWDSEEELQIEDSVACEITYGLERYIVSNSWKNFRAHHTAEESWKIRGRAHEEYELLTGFMRISTNVVPKDSIDIFIDNTLSVQSFIGAFENLLKASKPSNKYWRPYEKLGGFGTVTSKKQKETVEVDAKKSLLDDLLSFSEAVPKEAWDEVPKDLAENLDQYLYCENKDK